MRTESDSERDGEGTLATVDPADASSDAATTAGNDHSTMPAARTAPDEDVPRTPGRLRSAVSARFRLPAEDDPAPRTKRLVGLSLWAAVLAFLGLIPGGRLGVTLALSLDAPAWYAPVTLAIGVLGIVAMMAGFAAIHRDRLPTYLFSLATLLLLTNIALAYTAL
ncbi:hypothetical protein Cs7R123_30470 [Catellatospora sp. TT07R-123]|uniref:hypothetical protein n=1 Tax=Catellatospora sp. TT07R-123 TaxID=2733863 RepID=UPI001B24B223|nr:hypothetical protein [Catellatospora sp. TT07R-123]GHJ45705.1 hypothetical protein Cs7R123_30470 [Catellatospora sp. TT07R-123]